MTFSKLSLAAVVFSGLLFAPPAHAGLLKRTTTTEKWSQPLAAPVAKYLRRSPFRIRDIETEGIRRDWVTKRTLGKDGEGRDVMNYEETTTHLPLLRSLQRIAKKLLPRGRTTEYKYKALYTDF